MDVIKFNLVGAVTLKIFVTGLLSAQRSCAIIFAGQNRSQNKTRCFPLTPPSNDTPPGYELALCSQCNELKILLEEGNRCCHTTFRPLLESVDYLEYGPLNLFTSVDHAQLRAKLVQHRPMVHMSFETEILPLLYKQGS